MPIYEIPAESGPFAVVRSADGSFAVADERILQMGMDPKTAVKLGLILIPCKDESQAEQVAEELAAGDPSEERTVQVDLL